MHKNLVKQSETFRRSYVFRNGQTKAILDLTGCTAYSQMRTKPGGELIAEAECSIDVPLGRVTALWTSEQTAAIDPGTYYFDVWLKCDDDQRPFTTEQVDVIPTITEIEDNGA